MAFTQTIQYAWPMELFWPFVLFSISMAFTPGPNNAMLMTSGLNHGIKPSLPHQMGVVLGFPSMMLIAGLGAGNLLLSYPDIHLIMQILGSLYLLYFAWTIATTVTAQQIEKRPPFRFWQAALFQWVNPKAWMMVVGAIGTYTTASSPITQQILIIVLISFVVGLSSSSTWLFLGSFLQKIITQPKHVRWFNYTMAALLVLSVLPVIIHILQNL